ncbi:hypothetical protein JM946_08085 [Steroidobacter sp. S1-65]|uniref:Lipoprotein n=1 Tax=Steroidobacter gossypii TaxID=2805490 RepID=A0ABS1WUR6_9GAMM|nr:hypothetical protein [Steroidobacter gossypii]MBM0104702.1 hypothetical protein [Steroidobacter gossypii]
MARWMLLFILLLAGLSRVASACTCRPGLSLEEHYQRADHILIAKITGCAPDRLSQDGQCRDHGWTFDTIENLKGSEARVQQRPASAGYVSDTCDIAFKIGELYLLFLEEGRTHACSGTGILSGETGARKQSDLEILRAYRDGTISKIVNPWYFSDSGWYCGIDHLLEGGAELRFGYVYGTPPVPVRSSADGSPTPVMTLKLVGAFDVPRSTRLVIDGEPVPLTRATTQVTATYTYSADTVKGAAALAFVDRLMQPAELVFSGHRSVAGEPPKPFRATTNTAHAPDAAARFKACVAAHPAAN